jgi:hypothetical protein
MTDVRTTWTEMTDLIIQRIDALEQELRHQWEANHFEHCQRDWPHEGQCYWPLPDLLAGRPYVRRV